MSEAVRNTLIVFGVFAVIAIRLAIDCITRYLNR